MAEEDDASKTEDPTARKLEKARDKGEVASSREVRSWMILLGGAFAMIVMAPGIMRDIRLTSLKFIESPDAIAFDIPHLRHTFSALLGDLAWALLPLMGLLVVLALVANVGQTGFIWAPERPKPEVSKISPIKGAKRIFGATGFMEFIKGLAKLSLVTVVAFGLAVPLLGDIALLPSLELGQTLDRIHWISIWLVVGTVAVMTAIAALDFAYQKFADLKKMRRTKQAVKDEHKQSAGDPLVKARIRKLRMARAQERMMAAVPKADVVITDPTHYAVALEYKMKTMPAPKVVAKGMDSLARCIRAVAGENDVPVVENAPLAQALYATVGLDEEIPDEHYKAVAEIIGYVLRLKGQLPDAPPAPPAPHAPNA